MSNIPVILDGLSSGKRIAGYLKACTRARLAVAYWGAGANENLGLFSRDCRGVDVQIVCDLMSGACNPAEIRALFDAFGPDRVRTRDKLHAKVWITDAGCVLGSSNASANGHGHEGRETSGLIEANLAFDKPSPNDLASWETWFAEKVWLGAVAVDEDLLRQANEIWKWRRAGRDGPTGGVRRHIGGSLLVALKENPDRFKDKRLRVYIYKADGFSKIAKFGLEEASRTYKSIGYTGNLDGYEELYIDPDTYILDFHISSVKSRNIIFSGLWKVLSENSHLRLEGTFLTLCTEEHDFEGLTVKRDRSALSKAALQIAESTGKTDIDWSGYEFGKWLAEHS